MRVASLKAEGKAEHQAHAARSASGLSAAPGFTDRSAKAAQLGAMVQMMQRSAQVAELGSLAQMMQASPQVTAQMALKAQLAAGAMATAQRVGSDEEELLQGKFATVQRAEGEEEELLQGKFAPIQRAEIEDEEPLQGKFAPAQRAAAGAAPAPSPNQTGLPDGLKAGIESLSGISLNQVRVHYNSSQPAQLNAHAYAQGSEIHLAPGQEQHLPHEAWHVVQQAQGRVRPTLQMQGGVPVNDDAGLEREADVMGAKALTAGVLRSGKQMARPDSGIPAGPVQRLAMALDSVQALAERKPDFTDKEAESARTITNAFADRVRATGESVAAPHQVTTHDQAGGLAQIGLTEELRLFGHGQTTQLSGDEAVQIGSYTPQKLAKLLIDMGLPQAYSGEIYLSGCLTAVGPGYGFLGKFYALISQHAPGVIVRGNLGSAVTYPDGTQGVWTGITSPEEHEKQMVLFTDKAKELLQENDKLLARFNNKTHSEQDIRNAPLIKEQLESLAASRLAYLQQVYDPSGAYTVTLPDGSMQASNAIKAVVSGAVTEASDVERLLARLNDGNLKAAISTLDNVMPAMAARSEELIDRTAALNATPIKFSKGK